MTTICARCEASHTGSPKKCTECGYHPEKQLKLINGAAVVVGLLVSLTFIGAIIGIPVMIVGGYRLYKFHNIDVSNDRGI